MKKNTNFWLLMFLAISLALPICSLAQTQLKMRLMTESGDMITTTEPRIKNFFLSSGDGTLSIILQDPLNFTFADSDARIEITNPGTDCKIPGDGSVTVNAGRTVEFDVYSNTQGAAISKIIVPVPGGDFIPGTTRFKWVTTQEDIGTYLAVFQAQATEKRTSQIVVMIKVVPPGYSLTVNIQGNGTVTKNPDKTAYNLNPAETVQLTATPGNGYYFSGWSGDLSGSTNPASIIMNGNKTVTATFTATPTYTLQVNSSDSGVSITVSQTDNNQQKDGSAPFSRLYNQNTSVTLTAPSTYNNKNFSGWTGADSVSGTQATVTMTGNKTVTVNYTTTPTYTLQVNSSDSGVSITVSQTDNNSNKDGSAPFSRLYNQDTSVTLTAPLTYNGKNFSSWTGADSVSVTQATVNMTSNKTVTANYTAAPSGENLPWTLTNYTVLGSPGPKKIFIINIPPGKTYGSVTICSLDPSTSFTYKFTPIPGYLFLGRSEITGSIYYGILELPFSASYFTPRTTDGYVPTGDSILELNFISTGRILISTSIY